MNLDRLNVLSDALDEINKELIIRAENISLYLSLGIPGLAEKELSTYRDKLATRKKVLIAIENELIDALKQVRVKIIEP